MNTVLFTLLACGTASKAKHGSGENEVEQDPTNIPTSSSTAVSPPMPSSSSSPFQWINPTNATTCQSTTFSWFFSGRNHTQMTLTVTNERVAQQSGSSAPMLHTYQPLVTRTLSTNISAPAQQDVWASVDVPEGWYVAIAFNTVLPDSTLARSPPFFVQNGTDVSCLNTASFANGTSAPSTSPSPVSSSHRSLSTGQLVGTVAGAIIGIAIVVAAFTFPRLWRRALPTAKRPGGPYLLY